MYCNYVCARARFVLVARRNQVDAVLPQTMVSDRLRDAAPMPTDDEPPSALWCLAAALLPALLFCCFLHPSALLWWLPVWVAIFYLPMPAMLQDGPKNFMLCTLAVYWTAHAEGWSTSRVLLGIAAWSKCSLGTAPARLLCLLRSRLAALESSALPGRGRPTALVARAIQSRRSHRL